MSDWKTAQLFWLQNTTSSYCWQERRVPRHGRFHLFTELTQQCLRIKGHLFTWLPITLFEKEHQGSRESSFSRWHIHSFTRNLKTINKIKTEFCKVDVCSPAIWRRHSKPFHAGCWLDSGNKYSRISWGLSGHCPHQKPPARDTYTTKLLLEQYKEKEMCNWSL